MDAYWRAANYLSVGQIYLYDNPLLKQPLELAHIKPRLLGHWGTTQISDSNAPGMGATVAKDLFGAKNPNENKVISTAVDNLSRLLNTVSKFLPDISEFSATDDIERGVIVGWNVLLGSLKVLAAFAIPMALLAYAFLKRKEVAP